MPSDPAPAPWPDDAQPEASLPPEWAFVLQLRADTSFAAEGLRGRIEHVATGQAALFGSLEAARAFMERVMTNAPSPPP